MVGGGLEKTIANMHISLAIPSPMDVKHPVIFEMDSSKVLLIVQRTSSFLSS